MSKKCITCAYWRGDDRDPNIGACFVAPPTIQIVPVNTLQGAGIGAQSVRPQTKANDFCAQHVTRTETRVLS
jgi:hypothetical protein